MQDEKETEPATRGAQWVPSPNYRLVHSNLFRYRFNTGEMTIHFDAIVDTGVAPNMTPIVVGEVSVAMSWPQIKALSSTLQNAVAAIEKEIGPITMPQIREGAVADEQDAVRRVLKGLYLLT